MSTIFTAAAFKRSHGRSPSGRGTWAFQRTDSALAYDYHLYGESEFVSGTLSEAKAKIHKLDRDNGEGRVWAILP